ncbi:MAG: helix-turn-helix transcriptional regulator [Candidatus Izemoplasma sp.]|nr:helix-turn-helix transcriptional regulator [Candidatus Izemoplasma sp.]
MLYDKIEIGKRIRKLRVESNLTQDEAAKLIGVSNKTLSDWEKGKTDFTIQRLKEISDGFNIGINYLIPFDYEDFDVDDVSFKSNNFGLKKVGLFISISLFLTFYLNLFVPSLVLNPIILIEFILFFCYLILQVVSKLTSKKITKKYTRKNKLVYQSVYTELELKRLYRETVELLIISIFITIFSAFCIIGFYFSSVTSSAEDISIVLLFIMIFIWGIILLIFFIKNKPIKPILDYFRTNKLVVSIILNIYIILISLLFMYGLILNVDSQLQVPEWFIVTIFTYLLFDILFLLLSNYMIQKYFYKLDIISINPITNQLKVLYSIDEKIPEIPE